MLAENSLRQHLRKHRQPVREVPAYAVDEIVVVLAYPFRTERDAVQLAQRIAAAPDDYLAVCRDFEMRGVIDLRGLPTAAAEFAEDLPGDLELKDLIAAG